MVGKPYSCFSEQQEGQYNIFHNLFSPPCLVHGAAGLDVSSLSWGVQLQLLPAAGWALCHRHAHPPGQVLWLQQCQGVPGKVRVLPSGRSFLNS